MKLTSHLAIFYIHNNFSRYAIQIRYYSDSFHTQDPNSSTVMVFFFIVKKMILFIRWHIMRQRHLLDSFRQRQVIRVLDQISYDVSWIGRDVSCRKIVHRDFEKRVNERHHVSHFFDASYDVSRVLLIFSFVRTAKVLPKWVCGSDRLYPVSRAEVRDVHRCLSYGSSDVSRWESKIKCQLRIVAISKNIFGVEVTPRILFQNRFSIFFLNRIARDHTCELMTNLQYVYEEFNSMIQDRITRPTLFDWLTHPNSKKQKGLVTRRHRNQIVFTGDLNIRLSVNSLKIILFNLLMKTLSSNSWIRFDCPNFKEVEYEKTRNAMITIFRSAYFLYIYNDDRKSRRTDPNTFGENNLSSTMIWFNWPAFDSMFIIFDTGSRSSICFFKYRYTKVPWAFVGSFLLTLSVMYRVEYLVVDEDSKRGLFSLS